MKKLWFLLVVLFGFSLFQTASAEAEKQPGHQLRLMALNIWNEGKHVQGGFDKLVDVLLESKADIIALTEVRNYNKIDWPTKAIDAMKKKDPSLTYYTGFYKGDVGIISRYPIESGETVFDAATTEDAGSLIAYRMTLPGGLKTTVCVAHLDYRYYGLNLIRGYNGGYPDFKMIGKDKKGSPERVTNAKKVLDYNRKSKKMDAINAFLKFARQERAQGRLVILAGDFNDGSHLDWTKKAADHFGHYGAAINWDTSMALYKNGFLDAYRILKPDEVKNPGFTWPSIADGKKTTSWTPGSDERDRLDYIYYPAKAPDGFKPVKSMMVGPRAHFINEEKTAYPGDDDFICDTMPWPTDHTGVIVEFTWQ